MKKLHCLFIMFIGIFIIGCSNSEGVRIKVDLLPVCIDGKWGYANSKGEMVILPQFQEATIFVDGLALVKQSEKYGYINDDGKFEINPIYEEGTIFSEGKAFARLNDNEIVCIDNKGKSLFVLTDVEKVSNFSQGKAAVCKDSKWGYIDKTGKVVIQYQFVYVGMFNEDRAFVINDEGKNGFINEDGKITINNIYTYASSFNSGLALVKNEDSKYGFIDKDGKVVIPFQYDDALPFQNGLAAIKKNGKWGYVDRSSNLVIKCIYDVAYPFSDKCASVEKDKKYYYIDKTGNEVNSKKYQFALPYNNGLGIAKVKDKFQITNRNGEVLGSTFDNIDLAYFYSFEYGNIVYSKYTYLSRRLQGSQYIDGNKNSKCGFVSRKAVVSNQSIFLDNNIIYSSSEICPFVAIDGMVSCANYDILIVGEETGGNGTPHAVSIIKLQQGLKPELIGSESTCQVGMVPSNFVNENDKISFSLGFEDGKEKLAITDGYSLKTMSIEKKNVELKENDVKYLYDFLLTRFTGTKQEDLCMADVRSFNAISDEYKNFNSDKYLQLCFDIKKAGGVIGLDEFRKILNEKMK